MPSIDGHTGFAKDIVDVVDALAGGRIYVGRGIVFGHTQCALAGHGDVLIPIDGDVVHPAIATPFTDKSHSLFGTIAVGIDGDGGVAVTAFVLMGLKDAVGHTGRMFEMVLSPEVSQGFMLPKGTVARHVPTINGLQGAYLLIHGHTEQWGETEVDGPEMADVDFIEVALCLGIVEMTILVGIHVEVEGLDVVGDDGVDHPIFVEVKIVAIACLMVFEQPKHILLCQRREKKGKLLVIVAVAGIKSHFKLFVGHHGEILIAQVSCLVSETVTLPPIGQRAFFVCHATFLAIENEIGGGGVAIDESCLLIVFRIRGGDFRR